VRPARIVALAWRPLLGLLMTLKMRSMCLNHRREGPQRRDQLTELATENLAQIDTLLDIAREAPQRKTFVAENA
jgi:hypothetical protein